MKSRLCLDGFQQFLSGNRFGRKLDHDLTTADGNMLLVEGVEGLFAFFADMYQTGISQDGKVMGDGGLRKADLLDDFTDREFATTTLAHDFLARIVCNGFGK